MADHARTLNEEAFRIVRTKEDVLTQNGTAPPKNFSIVYMGDTHIGMSICDKPPYEKPIDKYEQLLKKIISSNSNGEILAIVHGGDATDHGENNLKLFIDKTWEVLYNPYTDDKQKIPLFLNIGNHDYKLTKNKNKITNGDLTAFNNLVASDRLFESDTKAKHPDVQVVPLNPLFLRVILLNTGFGNRGEFGSIDKDKFKKEINQIDNWMTFLEGQSNSIRFIIDMHIPPQIGPLGSGDTTHVLNNEYAALFTKNIMNKHYKRIISVVAHHRHCKPVYSYYDPNYNLYFFLTPAGGNCDTVCGGKCDPTCKSNSTRKYPYPYFATKVNYKYVNGILTVDATNPSSIIDLKI